MAHAVILSSAGKLNTTGGSFADTLTALTGDSLSVVNFDSGGARIIEMWGIDSDSVAELQVIYTRPDSTHDQQHGVRFGIASLVPGGAGNVGSHDLLPGYATIPLFPSDSATMQVTTTANDEVLVSWLTEYDDAPGITGAQFASWDSVQALRKSTVGIQCTAVASGTAASYGTQRAINADDDRFHGDTYYAILGASVQTQVTTISLIGPEWGGQRIGFPAGAEHTDSTTWFVDASKKWNKPLIPVFNSSNKGNILVQVADSEASTSPKIDFLMYELTGRAF